MKPGMSVSRVAREHDLNTNQVFKWRRLYERGVLPSRPNPLMLPVRIEDSVAPAGRIIAQPPQPQARHPCAARTGCMEIELRGGRVIVQGSVDSGALRLVIKMLSR